MIDKRLVAIGFLLFCLLAGGAAKAVRYADRFAPQTDAVIGQLNTMLGEAGWRKLASSEGRVDEPYTWVSFAKTGCQESVTISILGRTTELVPLVGMFHGGDVIYIDGGRLVEKPSALSARLDAATAGRTDDGHFGRQQTLPLLAVSPRSAVGAGRCSVPLTNS